MIVVSEDDIDGSSKNGVGVSEKTEDKDVSNWTMSLDRRNPLSPQKKRYGEEKAIVSSGPLEEDEGMSDNEEDTGHTVHRAHKSPTRHTDPTPRKGVVGVTINQDVIEETDHQRMPVDTSNGHHNTCGSVGHTVLAASSHKPPLPPGVREGRKDKQQQTKNKQQQTTKDKQQQQQQNNVRHYIAQMRVRGHKRSSSAPTPYQPPTLPLSSSGLTSDITQDISYTVRDEGERQGRRRGNRQIKVWYLSIIRKPLGQVS